MNLIISVIVSGLAAGALVFGGVQAYVGATEQKPVSNNELYNYSSR
jgi:hypothetical protein